MARRGGLAWRRRLPLHNTFQASHPARSRRSGLDPLDLPGAIVKVEIHINDRLDPHVEHLRRAVEVRLREDQEPAGIRAVVDNLNDAPSLVARHDPAERSNGELPHAVSERRW
jgi:hypothetical protein